MAFPNINPPPPPPHPTPPPSRPNINKPMGPMPEPVKKPINVEKSVWERGIGLSRMSLKGYMRSEVKYDPYNPGLKLTRVERLAEAEKINKLAKQHMLGSNIGKEDVKKILNNKFWGLKRELYEKRDTKEAPKIRKEIKFWENQLKPKN